MKFLPAVVSYFFQDRTAKANVASLLRFVVVLAAMMVVYSFVFQLIMALEGRTYSFVHGIYWTVVTMTTLGYGDITFTSDLGKAFSVLVLLSGVVFLLVMLPFTFIRFFYAPWLEAHNRARTPRKLPEDTHGHVLLTGFDPLIANLIGKLSQYDYDYAVIAPDQQEALDLYNQGYRVVVGDLDDVATYRNARADQAALVMLNCDDPINTHAAFTLRELSQDTPVVAAADYKDAIDILELAGCNEVYHFSGMLGRSLARRVLGVGVHANIIGRFSDLLIAEHPAMRTELEGKRVAESRVRESTGVTIVGIWERGSFKLSSADTLIQSNTVLVLAGSREQLEQFSKVYGLSNPVSGPVLIIGGGSEGLAAGETLAASEIDYRIVERLSNTSTDSEHTVVGDATDLATLKKAGIDHAPSVIITTGNDDINIYLTIYCRKLRPDVQIISRARHERSVGKLHEAGADLVMSYASMGANSIINYLKGDNVLMVAEGLHVFREPTPPSLRNKTIAKSNIRAKTNCSVIAVALANRETVINPAPDHVLSPSDELILIGTSESERKFFTSFRKRH